jgi:hypothetical protein
MVDDTSDVSHVEGRGALNFLALDDRDLREEAEPLHPGSILALPFVGNRPEFPSDAAERTHPFLQAVHASRRKWIVLTDPGHHPRFVLNANTFLRAVLMEGSSVDPMIHCHEPLVVTEPETKLEALLGDIELRARRPGGQALHPTLILLWTPEDKRVLTGVDLLETLLRGVTSPGSAQV